MTRLATALLGAALAFATGPALATGIVPLSGSQQFDVATSPPAFLNGGKLFVYQPGTTTCAAIFSDFALTAALPCPIVLNTAGRIPSIYAADGSVRLRILNSLNVLQYDQDNVAIVTAAATSGGGSTPIPDSTQIFGTRDLKIRFDDQPITGYVRMNGRTIGSATSGATERANADTQPMYSQLWSFANVSVVAGKGASAAADWAANKQLVLPDMSGHMLGGVDDMGAGPANRITSASIPGSTVVGATGGTDTKTITQQHLPAVNWTSSLGVSRTGSVTLSAAAGNVVNGAGVGGGANLTGGGAALNQGAITVVDTQAWGVTGNVSSGGSGALLNGMPPTMLLTFYLKL